jgi:predicted nucleotidyltransferase
MTLRWRWHSSCNGRERSSVEDFTQLLSRLADAGIEFVIIGGYAAITHGSSYLTRDVDICAMLTDENVAKLRGALANWNPVHRLTSRRLSFLHYPPAGEPLSNLYLQTDKGVIDVLSSVLGVGDFCRLKRRAEKVRVEGRQYLVISLNDLIKSKEALGRERDLLAAKELRAIAAKRRRRKA